MGTRLRVVAYSWLLAAGLAGAVAAEPATGRPGEGLLLKTIRDRLGVDAVRREYVFAKSSEEELRLDIYFPRAAPPPGGYPLVIWLHGGGWILGSKRQDVFVRHFPQYGYAVASIEYRLAGGAKFPAQIADARTATWWLWKNARALEINPDRLIVAGQSAGGHLALLLAYTQGENRKGWGPAVPPGALKAVAVMYPPTDLIRLVPPGARDNPLHPVGILLGGKMRERMAMARAASPINHVKGGNPPTLLLHGASDSIVPPEQSEILARRLKAAGVPTQLRLTDGGHAFTLYPDHVKDVVNFINSVPALKGSVVNPPK